MSHNAPRHIRSGWSWTKSDDRHLGYAAVVRCREQSERRANCGNRGALCKIASAGALAEGGAILHNVHRYTKFLRKN